VGLDLECEAVPHRHLQAAMNGLLGLTHRERTVGGNAPGYFKRALQQAFRFDHPVDKSPCFRLQRREPQARQDQLLGATLAYGPGQILGTARARHDAKGDLRQRKARITSRSIASASNNSTRSSPMRVFNAFDASGRLSVTSRMSLWSRETTIVSKSVRIECSSVLDQGLLDQGLLDQVCSTKTARPRL